LALVGFFQFSVGGALLGGLGLLAPLMFHNVNELRARAAAVAVFVVLSFVGLFRAVQIWARTSNLREDFLSSGNDKPH
jgi:hypothetical protein